MTKQDRLAMENTMVQAFETLIEHADYGGKYCSFTPGHENYVDEAEYQALVGATTCCRPSSLCCVAQNHDRC